MLDLVIAGFFVPKNEESRSRDCDIPFHGIVSSGKSERANFVKGMVTDPYGEAEVIGRLTANEFTFRKTYKSKILGGPIDYTFTREGDLWLGHYQGINHHGDWDERHGSAACITTDVMQLYAAIGLQDVARKPQ